jgi:ABC-type glutathione transport system ATPase component
MVIMASASGNTVPAIARLVQGDEDAIRGVIRRFNEIGLACLAPAWAGGRPRLISPEDEVFIIATAATRPEALDQPFTRWSLRKLSAYLTHDHGTRRVVVGRERLRQFLRRHEITFQWTKTWKEAHDPDRDTKLARIEHVSSSVPDRVVRRVKTTVLEHLDLAIAEGAVTGVLGPNGSDKTTLQRAIVGAQRISGGAIRALDRSAGDPTPRADIGDTTQAPSVYGYLTAEQNVRYHAALHQLTAHFCLD